VTELTPDLADAIVASVERGASSFDAAEVNGVSRDTLRRWLRIAEQDATYWPGTNSLVSEGLKSRIAEFAERLTRAKAGKRVVLTSNLLHNATTPNEKTGWYDTQAIDKLMAKDGDNREHWYENKQSSSWPSQVVTRHWLHSKPSSTPSTDKRPNSHSCQGGRGRSGSLWRCAYCCLPSDKRTTRVQEPREEQRWTALSSTAGGLT
jgi:transposase-like protein